MKKTLSAVLLALFLMGSVPSLAFATDGSTATSSNITSLLAQISALMRQINELQGQVKTLNGQVREAVKEEKKKENEEHKPKPTPKPPVLIKCADSDGTYSWNGWGGWGNGYGWKKGWHKKAKNKPAEFRKFIRYCRDHSTSTSTDITAPTISSITISSVTANTATIAWTTNEVANSVVVYGTTTSYGATSSLPALVTSHSVTLTGLVANTLHNFSVRSSDAAGNLVVSSNLTFTTENTAPVDTVSPVISSVAVSNITASGATVTWTTNEPSDSQISYGTTVAYGSTTTLDNALITSHSVVLTGLSSSTLYHIAVRSKDASANLAVSPDVSFTTSIPADVTAPSISAISAVVGSTTATVNWTTNENANSKVYYGTATPLVLGTATTLANTSLVAVHALALSGLSTSTTYYYVVESVDAAANISTSSQQSFTTGN